MINAGRMAVVLEVEVSEPFNCRGANPASCNQAIVDRGLRRAVSARRPILAPAEQVRQPAYRGALRQRPGRRGDQRREPQQLRLVLGRGDLQGPRRDNTIESGPPPAAPPSATRSPCSASRRERFPLTRRRRSCNTPRPDRARATHGRAHDGPRDDRQPRPHEPARRRRHADARRVARLLRRDLAPRMDGPPQLAADLPAPGGMAFPAAGSAQGFVDAWRTYRPKATPQFFGWGYGADLGGLATQGAPAPAGSPTRSLTRSSRWTAQRRSTASARASAYSTTRPRASRTTGCTRSGTRSCEGGGPRIAEDMLRGPEALPPDVGARRRHTRQRVQGARTSFAKRGLESSGSAPVPASSWRRRASRCGGHGPGAGAPWASAGSVALRPR